MARIYPPKSMRRCKQLKTSRFLALKAKVIRLFSAMALLLTSCFHSELILIIDTIAIAIRYICDKNHELGMIYKMQLKNQRVQVAYLIN